MFVTMALAALAIDGLFSVLGLIPSGARPGRDDIFGSVQVDYKLFLNLLGLLIFAALFWLTQRRGATDPVCAMKVDRAKAITKEFGGETFYFCSEHCLHPFELEAEQYADAARNALPVDHGAARNGGAVAASVDQEHERRVPCDDRARNSRRPATPSPVPMPWRHPDARWPRVDLPVDDWLTQPRQNATKRDESPTSSRSQESPHLQLESASSWPNSNCLPCRRSRVRVPSAASKTLQIGTFSVLCRLRTMQKV
jgi:YHS domain-containing protein